MRRSGVRISSQAQVRGNLGRIWLPPPAVHSFRATSGPVMRLMSGNDEAMMASEAASPPKTVAQYAIPGRLNAMPT
jgi:hypothetical protein